MSNAESTMNVTAVAMPNVRARLARFWNIHKHTLASATTTNECTRLKSYVKSEGFVMSA